MLVDPVLPTRESGHSSQNGQDSEQDHSYATKSPRDHNRRRAYTSSENSYEDSIFEDFYSMDGQKKIQSTTEPPALPQKSSLRASQLLDNLNLKLGGAIQTKELSQATPHDVYLSSEEDASSDADDFSDYEYDYDSSSEDSQSPIGRSSHEVTARVVSVVFAGKPSIIDLPAIRRSISPISMEARRRASTVSSISPVRRTPSSAGSSISSSVCPQHQPQRMSGLVSSLLPKKKPPFLHLDPYANGSTYSLELPKQQEVEGPQPVPKTPRTPAALFRGVSRTLSLVRKRSRPLLNIPAAIVSRDDLAATRSPECQVVIQESIETSTRPELPQLPRTPVTYNNIIKAAKKNTMVMAPHPSPSSPQATSPMISTAPAVPPVPEVPAVPTKRGILSGLAARRRSIKLTSRVL